MQFSIIIPVLNEMKNIQNFLESLYTQTVTPDEIIIADGWSTDGTYDFLKKEEKN